MASSISTTLKNLESALLKLGLFDHVATVEAKSAPGNGMFAAVFFASAQPAAGASGLNQASGQYVFTVRLHTNFLQQPEEEIDAKLIEALDKVIDALAEDLDLGATVRNVDFFGAHGQPLRADAGYVEVGGTNYRVIDLTLPLIVNDSVAAYG